MSARFRGYAAFPAVLALVVGCATAAPTPAPPTPSVAPLPSATAVTPTATPLLPTPGASATPSPTSPPTEGPTSTPSASAPASTSSPTPTIAPADGITVSEAAISAHLDAFAAIAAQNGGLRAAGLPGYDASVDYVAGQLETFGYAVERDAFDFEFFDEAAPVQLTVGDQSWSGGDWLHAMLYSAPGNVSGVLETVALEGGFAVGTAGCDPGDWATFTAGHIAVLASGPCFRRDQIANAQQAGAIGVISVYPRWEQGQTRRPTLLTSDGITIPAIVAGQEPTLALLAAAEARGTAQLVVETIAEQRTIENVIAELPGSTNEVVFLGGHLDSVLDGPGINDNGSGVATLLAIAEAAASQPQPQSSIRFGFWGAEEFGTTGSTSYVNRLAPDELARIRAYLNLDMVGSPNAGRFVYDDALAAPGSADLTAAILAALAALDAPGEPYDIGASSDHFAFGQAGIPTGGVFSGLAPLTDEQAQLFGGEAGLPADPCYHLACDGRDNIDIGAAVTLGQAIADVLADLAY